MSLWPMYLSCSLSLFAYPLTVVLLLLLLTFSFSILTLLLNIYFLPTFNICPVCLFYVLALALLPPPPPPLVCFKFICRSLICFILLSVMVDSSHLWLQFDRTEKVNVSKQKNCRKSIENKYLRISKTFFLLRLFLNCTLVIQKHNIYSRVLLYLQIDLINLPMKLKSRQHS